MPRFPAPRCVPLMVLVLLLLAPPARAEEVEIPLASGKSVRGHVAAATPEEVVLRIGEQERRLPWSALAPLGAWRCHRALAPPADGEARLKLAVLAVDLGLFVEAREEFEKALALGALKANEFAERVAAAERAAVENGVALARQRAESGDLEGALEEARRLRQHFSEAPGSAAIGRLIADLVKRIQSLDAQALADQEELARIQVESRRQKEVLERRVRATDRISNGERAAEESARYREQGSVTRARKHAEEADGLFQDARLQLGRLRRILPEGDPERREVLARLAELDRQQFALRFAMARFFAESRTWTQAERWIQLSSYIDPVHPDLMALREEVASVRIRYRLSDMTNARPIVR